MNFKLPTYNFICVILILLTIGIAIYACYLWKQKTFPHIYCIMITGKDSTRYKFAKLSIENFQNQTYHYKHLLIVNHGQKLLTHPGSQMPNISEILVNKEKHNLMLGDLRNIALEMVPINAFWFPWDDDDYRHPLLLQSLADTAIKKSADVVSLTTRLEYNKNTRFCWKMTIRSGMVLSLVKKDPRFQYLRKDSLEDIHLLDTYKKYGYNVVTINNNPMWYLRLVHSNNTSLYVNPNKKSVYTVDNQAEHNYVETECTDIERSHVHNILLSYYKDILYEDQRK